MPELPEVETTRRSLAERVVGLIIERVVIRESRLRWPVSPEIPRTLPSQVIESIHRRAKYLLIQTPTGTLLVHLGMSGSLRLTSANEAPEKHDHVDVLFSNGLCLRYRDPRRFGAILWTNQNPSLHPLLAGLGPEPLNGEFRALYLHRISRNRRIAIKNLIMNSHIVVGIGNIYANEALFLSRIHPARAAGKISLRRYAILVEAIKEVLRIAIDFGGTTLRDFTDSNGQPGYFAQQLFVYGRNGENCYTCGTVIRLKVLGQRSTFYCPKCQR